MDFFKSVFADDLEPSKSPAAVANSTLTGSPKSSDETDIDQIPNPSSAWSFGGLIQSLAFKSESVIQIYRRDFKEFGDGLKKEASVISEAIDKGTSVAQESLETVGQAIDDIGSTVWKSTAQIISHGKDTLLPNSVHDYDVVVNNRRLSGSGSSSGLDVNNKPYSRFENQVRALQCDETTYCTELEEDKEDYDQWRKGFVLNEKEIEGLISENGAIMDVYRAVVPSRVADRETFWVRFFYKVYKLKQAEDARARLVKRAMSCEEEEDLSWDFYDDEEKNNVSRQKSGDVGAGKRVEAESSVDGMEEKAEGKEDNGSSSGKDSDISIIPSQPSMPSTEDDLGWDEMEDTASNYENDDGKREITGSGSKADLRKRLGAAEDKEDLSWDIEDDDDEPSQLNK